MTFVSEVRFHIDASSDYYPDNLERLFADEVAMQAHVVDTDKDGLEYPAQFTHRPYLAVCSLIQASDLLINLENDDDLADCLQAVWQKVGFIEQNAKPSESLKKALGDLQGQVKSVNSVRAVGIDLG